MFQSWSYRTSKMRPDMLQVVTQPMDLTTVKTRLDNSFYADLATCVGDLQQVWTNAKLYNPGHHTIHKWAEELNMITKGWVAKCHQQAAPSPPNPAPAPAAVPAAAPAPAPNEVEVNNQINLKVYILILVSYFDLHLGAQKLII